MVRIIRTLFGWLIVGVVFLIPWMIRATRVVATMVAVALSTLFVGEAEASHRIADQWTARTIELGVPGRFEPQIQRWATAVAYLFVFGCWMIVVVLVYLMLIWIL